MRTGTLAFIAGIILLQNLSFLPSANWAFGLILLLPLLIYLPSWWLKLPIVFLSGFLWALFIAQSNLSHSLADELEGKDIQIEGHIASIPVQRERQWRFEFDVDRLWRGQDSFPTPGKVRLNWYGTREVLQVGDRWRLTVRLKKPSGFMNPGGFDFERWLFINDIRATGYVRTKFKPERLSSSWQDYPVQRVRQSILANLNEQLEDHAMGGIIAALAIGHRAEISPEQWRLFTQTGTNHLVAISGLHIGLVAGLIYFLCNWAWSRLGRLALVFASPRAAAIAAILGALIYAALAGWSLPTQRAFIMITVAMLSIVLQRSVAPGRTLALAMLLVLVYDPMAVLSPGLWLSFGAVAVILFGIVGHASSTHWWYKWGRVQWIVCLGLVPLLILFFQQASVISPLANFIAVPLVSLLVVPLILLGVGLMPLSMQAGTFLIELSATLLSVLEQLLVVLANLPFSTWVAPTPHWGLIALALLGITLLIAPRGWPLRWSGVILLAPMLFYQPDRPKQGEWRFSLLDVGQGLAAVIQTQNHSLVFDTGPRFSEFFDTGSAVVVPFLRQQGIQQLDTLVVSHGDNDHIGGAKSVLNQIPANRVLSSAKALLAEGAEPCVAGQSWQWDGVDFMILSPVQVNHQKKENNQSCVLKISSPHGSVLLTGDIEAATEKELLNRYPKQLSANVLVAPHHGSKTSSSAKFVQAVHPNYVLFPVGYRNRYRFPHPKVVQRYQAIGSTMLSSTNSGAILFNFGANMEISPPTIWREQHRRYWHR
ncbi:MAG: DNA internalization-related competence protein ComEC/Rec2 [Gammaproteobacteria bacterium]|nr:DNA internalization-related competence protein ComEC/Rec2 [Gammaproteobacteria bacterium]